MLRTTLPFVLPVLAALTADVRAQHGDKPSTARAPFVVEAGETPLAALIDRAAAHLECNIVWREQDLAASGDVNPVLRLQAPITTDRDGCLELLADALYRSGFALTWANERLRVMEAISINGPRGRDVWNRAAPRTEQEILARPALRMPVTVTLPLQHVNATIATNALRPFFASAGGPGHGPMLTIGNVGNSAAMIVSGMQDQVAHAIRIVRECDLPSRPEPEVADTQKRVSALEARLQALEARLEQLAKTSK
jgi:hypothetical protein